MCNIKNTKLWNRFSNANPQYFCLAAALGMEFLLMALRGYGFYFVENYIIVPTMLFIGFAFGQQITSDARRQLLLPIAAICWFFVTQTLHYAMDMEVRNLGLFTSVYLLAYLFASFTQDGKKQWGLKMAAAACIGAALVLALFAGLLALDLLPGFLKPHVYWDGARLQAMWHPNICAIILMIGMSFCLVLFAESKCKWFKGLFLAGAVLFFLVMALTNSRTSILMASCIIAGFLFFCIWNGSWKRFIVGIVIALAVILLLFNTAGSIFQAHNDALISKYMRQAEESSAHTDTATNQDITAEMPSQVYVDSHTGELALVTDAGQRSFSENFRNLNGRTSVWKTCLRALKGNSGVLLLGVDSSEDFVSQAMGYSLAHTHNAWLEILVGLGLPGLLLALVFTGMAAWHIWVTFWGNTHLGQKVIAMLVLVLMGAGILEPYLFFTDIFYHYTDFIFFLCLGYLVHWRSDMQK